MDAYGDEADVLAGGSAADDIVFHAQLRDGNGVDVDDRGTALVAVTVLGLDTDESSASSVSSEWTTGGRVTFKLRTNVAGVYAVAAEVCPKSSDGTSCDDDGWVAARNDGASITVAPGAPSASASVVECGRSASAANTPATCAVTLRDCLLYTSPSPRDS